MVTLNKKALCELERVLILKNEMVKYYIHQCEKMLKNCNDNLSSNWEHCAFFEIVLIVLEFRQYLGLKEPSLFGCHGMGLYQYPHSQNWLEIESHKHWIELE